MRRPFAPSLSPQATGILWMLGSVVLFASMDAVAKGLSTRVDTVQALWARYAGQSVLVFAIILPRLGAILPTRYPLHHLARSCLQLGATSFFFFALARIGLAEATAIMEVAPVLVTLGAALFLGEKLGRRRLIAIAVALAGALIIIRPGAAVFTPAALLPLCGAICYAGYALVTRSVGPGESPWTALFYTGLVGSLVLSAIVPFRWVPPDATGWTLMAMIAALGAAGQFCIIRALSLAEASAVAPFTYLGLLFATLYGLAFFGEVPDALTILGALVIAGAGLYVWHRETRLGDVSGAGPGARLDGLAARPPAPLTPAAPPLDAQPGTQPDTQPETR